MSDLYIFLVQIMHLLLSSTLFKIYLYTQMAVTGLLNRGLDRLRFRPTKIHL